MRPSLFWIAWALAGIALMAGCAPQETAPAPHPTCAFHHPRCCSTPPSLNRHWLADLRAERWADR